MPRVLELAASEAAYFTAFDHVGMGEGLWPHLPPEHLPASLGLGGTLAFLTLTLTLTLTPNPNPNPNP